MLTGYKTPDPIPTFTAPRALDVFALEARGGSRARVPASFGRSASTRATKAAAAASMRGGFPRRRRYFEPAVTTDADGQAHVQLQAPRQPHDLPPHGGRRGGGRSLRLRRGAGDDQPPADGAARVPALPARRRRDRGGGRRAHEGHGGDAQVEVSARGGRARGRRATRSALVPGRTARASRCAGRSTAPHAGKAKLTFRARAGGEPTRWRSRAKWTRRSCSRRWRSTARRPSAAAEKLGDLRALRDDVGGLDVRLASTALVGLATASSSSSSTRTAAPSSSRAASCRSLRCGTLANDFGIAAPEESGRARGRDRRQDPRRTSAATAASAGGPTRARRTRG